MESKVKEF